MICIYTAVLLMITLGINALYMKMNRNDVNNVFKFRDVPEEIQICNFGSSHGMWGFDYEDVDLVSFNFALQAQTLSYDSRLFENYKDHLAKGAIVFIPVSYFSLYGTGQGNIGYEDEKNARYYSILPPELIQDYDLRTDLYVRYFSSLTAGVDLIRALSGRSRNTIEDEWPRTTTQEEVRQTAGQIAQGNIINGRMDSEGNRIINEDEIDSLKYIINTCHEMGCTPILLTLPLMRDYTDEVERLDPDFYGSFHDLIGTIADETGAGYYDYSRDERFQDNYDWFMDSNHLNKEGARNFVNILMQEVVPEEVK